MKYITFILGMVLSTVSMANVDINQQNRQFQQQQQQQLRQMQNQQQQQWDTYNQIQQNNNRQSFQNQIDNNWVCVNNPNLRGC